MNAINALRAVLWHLEQAEKRGDVATCAVLRRQAKQYLRSGGALVSPFETKTRDNGERFVTLKDDAPEWLQDAIREAHQGTMPHDWVYAECEAAFDAYTDQGERPDAGEHADGRVDVYTKDLYQWAADMCLTDLFAEAQEGAGELCSEESDMHHRLTTVQYCAIEMIASVIFDAIEANAEESAEP